MKKAASYRPNLSRYLARKVFTYIPLRLLTTHRATTLPLNPTNPP